MKTLLTRVVILVLLSSPLAIFGQKNDVLDYGDTIQAGLHKYEEEKYEEALEYYLSVPSGDTNYVTAIVEAILTYYTAEQFDKGDALAKTVVHEGFELNPAFFLNWGSCLDRLEKYDDAIACYHLAQETFPLNAQIMYNMGFSYLQKKDYEKSMEYFKKAIDINPLYAKPHYQLGAMAYNEGNTTLAILAFNRFLMIETGTELSNGILSALNEVCSSKYKEETEPKNIEVAKGEDYSEIDLLVENYVALDKKFKVKGKIQLPYVKQSYLVFQQMAELPESDNFWYRTYAPVCKAILNEEKFETYSYYISSSSYADKHKKIVQKNAAKINAFVKWLINVLDNSNRAYQFDFPKKEGLVNSVYRANEGFAISSIVQTDKDGNPKGYSENYYASGALKSTVNYGPTSYYEGEELVYYESGQLKEKKYYKEGVLQDSLILYSKYGRPYRFFTVKDDAIAGKVVYYFDSGAKSTEVDVISEMQQGEKLRYFENGTKYSSLTFTDNKANGEFKAYYNTGELSEKANYVNDLLEGQDSIFYRNGKLKIVQNFVEGERSGLYEEYYDDGQLKGKGNFLKGKEAGEHITYYRNGSKETVSNYDENGKKNGVYRELYDDGKTFFELDYKRGEVVAYRYFDRNGEVIKEDKRRMGDFEFEGHHQNGVISMKGNYDTKFNQGKWEYFDQNGVLASIKNFKDGELDGELIRYYPNGSIKAKEHYKDGKDWGYYVRYSPFETKQKEGYLLESEAVGLWKTYFGNDKLQEETFYYKDEKEGFKYEYAPNGELYKRIKYEQGVIAQVLYYGPSGEVIDSIMFQNGTGDYVLHFVDGKTIKSKYKNVNNGIEGSYETFFPNGNKEIEGQFFAGRRDGIWKYYSVDGQLVRTGSYEHGNKVGLWKYYYKNGKKKKEENYRNGELNGLYTSYYKNGKLEVKIPYKEGLKDGKAEFYASTGELDQYRYYKDGYIIAYEYKTKNGNKKIEVEKETATISAFFENGNPSRTFRIENGWFQGEFKEYHANGQLFQESFYLNNDYHGKVTRYYPSGKKKYELEYVKGEANGVETSYYENGKLKETITYLDGYLHGPMKIYDKTGKLIHHYEYYYNDMEEIVK